jgi:SAM-dependent methyltransferase
VTITNWSDTARWYDVLNPWGTSDDFYLGLVMEADRVLDVGCGTGDLLYRLSRARDAGHSGKLAGLDPDPAMLAQARARASTGIDWVQADAAAIPARWTGEFDLAVMTGHAFQNLITDDDVCKSLAKIGEAIADGGRFAFETRHPQARAWESWHDSSSEARNPDGDTVRVSYEVLDVTGDETGEVVSLTETFAGQWWEQPRVDHGTLRFLAPDALAAFLHEAGFVIAEQYGDWDRSRLTGASKEIITIARRT